MKIPAEQLIGKRFSYLVILYELPKKVYEKTKTTIRMFQCKCDCGKELPVTYQHLKDGHSKSCGCMKGKMCSDTNFKHGESGGGTVEYNIRASMLARCYNSNNAKYKSYGGRGIIVCQRWIDSYEDFLADMGRRPTNKHSIERIDNNGNYEPSNCKWGTKKEQSRNQRTNRWISYDGVTLILTDWAERLGMKQSALSFQLTKKPFELIAAKHELKNQLDRINKKYQTL